MTNYKDKPQEIKDQFSFKIKSPTMQSIIEIDGDVTLEIGNKVYRLIEESKLDDLIHSAQREERELAYREGYKSGVDSEQAALRAMSH